MRAPTSRCSRRSTRSAATPARPRAASTRRSETRPRTIPRSTPSTRSKGSDYLGDQDAIEILCNEAPDDVYQLENWGAVFSRTEDGRIAQRPFGAAGAPRTAYAADITGHVLVHVLYEQVMKRQIPAYEEYFAWKLVMNDDRCQGVIAWDLLERRAEVDRREDRHPRHRRRRPAVRRHDQRVLLHGRRDGARAATSACR